jgi:hypothetical protein
MTDAPELLPCPFCGGNACAIPDPDHSSGYIILHDNVGCVITGHWSWGRTEQEAVAAWNTRTDHANALVAAAYADVVKTCENASLAVTEIAGKSASIPIRALTKALADHTPADAQAALDQMLEEARQEGMKNAAKIAAEYPSAATRKSTGDKISDAILSALEGEET